MKKINYSDKEKLLGKWLVGNIFKSLIKKHPKLTKVEGNLIHFMAYDIIKKMPDTFKNMTTCWYYHGPYVPVIDDILIERGMDPEYHQMYGSKATEIMDKTIECECH